MRKKMIVKVKAIMDDLVALQGRKTNISATVVEGMHLVTVGDMWEMDITETKRGFYDIHSVRRFDDRRSKCQKDL